MVLANLKDNIDSFDPCDMINMLKKYVVLQNLMLSNTYSKHLCVWITSLVMQVFSGRVWPTRSVIETYLIPDTHLELV